MHFAFWTPAEWRRARVMTLRTPTGQITTASLPGNWWFWFAPRRRALRVLGLEVHF